MQYTQLGWAVCVGVWGTWLGCTLWGYIRADVSFLLTRLVTAQLLEFFLYPSGPVRSGPVSGGTLIFEKIPVFFFNTHCTL